MGIFFGVAAAVADRCFWVGGGPEDAAPVLSGHLGKGLHLLDCQRSQWQKVDAESEHQPHQSGRLVSLTRVPQRTAPGQH